MMVQFSFTPEIIQIADSQCTSEKHKKDKHVKLAHLRIYIIIILGNLGHRCKGIVVLYLL